MLHSHSRSSSPPPSSSLFFSFSREATTRRIISDLKSPLHHFFPAAPRLIPPPNGFCCSSSVPSSSSSFSSSASPSSSSSSSSSYSSSVLGVRLCFWLGSGVIGSPKPVLIIDPPAWQLPAKPLSTSCVPASAVSDSTRERPSEIRLDGSSKSRKKKSREGVRSFVRSFVVVCLAKHSLCG